MAGANLDKIASGVVTILLAFLNKCVIIKNGPLPFSFSFFLKGKKMNLAAHQVLVVEDDDIFINIITFLLMSLGFHNISVARNGQEAVAILRTAEMFGLIITDMNMPVMNGQELIKWVKTNDLRKQVPILMISQPTPGQAESLSHFLRQHRVPLLLKSDLTKVSKLRAAIKRIETDLA